MTILDSKTTVYDVSEQKWARPEIQPAYVSFPADPSNPFYKITSPDFTDEERAAAHKLVDVSGYFNDDQTDDVIVTEHEVPGCPEDPDTPAKVIVYTPKCCLERTGNNALFYLMGGGLALNEPNMFPLRRYALKYECVVVVPKYRLNFQVKLPGIINDCHAAYAWMVENADELHIDPDKVVLTGESSGGHLATALPFRLRRAGFDPRGVVAILPITDDRSYHASSRNRNGIWDGKSVQMYAWCCLGKDMADAYVPPELFANHATVEECVGYPPLCIITSEFDGDVDNSCEFATKVRAAHSFSELHCFGGMGHNAEVYGFPCEIVDLLHQVEDKALRDFWAYDLRRPWVVE